MQCSQTDNFGRRALCHRSNCAIRQGVCPRQRPPQTEHLGVRPTSFISTLTFKQEVISSAYTQAQISTHQHSLSNKPVARERIFIVLRIYGIYVGNCGCPDQSKRHRRLYDEGNPEDDRTPESQPWHLPVWASHSVILHGQYNVVCACGERCSTFALFQGFGLTT